MKKNINGFVIMAIAIILLNVYLLFTNFNLNRQLTSIQYVSSDKDVDNKNINSDESNIKNLKKILENSSEQSLSLINTITVSDNHINFDTDAENLDEIEALHIYLGKIYQNNKITVNITRQNDKFKALFEYYNQP